MASSAFSGVVPRKGRLRRWLILGVGGFLVVGVFALLRGSIGTDTTTVNKNEVGQASSSSGSGAATSLSGGIHRSVAKTPTAKATGPTAAGDTAVPVGPANGHATALAPHDVIPAVAAPGAGTYAYRYGTNSQENDGTMTVSAVPAPTSGVTRRAETDRVGGTTHRQTLDWSSRAVDIVSTDAGNGACPWSPPLTSWSLPLGVGRQWHADSTCAFTSPPGFRGAVHWVEDAKVVGAASTTVDGDRVVTWVIERHTLVTETVGGGAVTAETQSTELFAPRLGLVVYKTGRTATPNRDGSTTTTDSTLELQHVHPS